MATYVVEAVLVRQLKLDAAVSHMGSSLADVRLYTNDFDPGRDSSAWVFVEPTATGYLPQPCDGGWSAYAEGGDFTGFADHAAFIFDVTADSAEQYVYGWFIKDNGGIYLFAQRGEGPGFPFPFFRAGDRVIVKIRLTQESYAPPPPPAPSL